MRQMGPQTITPSNGQMGYLSITSIGFVFWQGVCPAAVDARVDSEWPHLIVVDVAAVLAVKKQLMKKDLQRAVLSSISSNDICGSCSFPSVFNVSLALIFIYSSVIFWSFFVVFDLVYFSLHA
jgi:hypothetical protein